MSCHSSGARNKLSSSSWATTRRARAARLPVSVMLTLSGGFLPLAVSVAELLWPAVVGAWWTVTAHDLPFPRAVPVHASEVIENAGEPETETVSMPVAD